MKNPFIKYVMREKKEDIFHSSAYGKAQSAEAMGTTSVEGFAKRMEVDGNRQIIKRYNDSRIANSAYTNGPRAKEYVQSEKGASMKVGGVDAKNNTSISGINGVSRIGGSAGTPGTSNASHTNNNVPHAAVSAVKRFTPSIKPKFGIK